MPGPDDQITGLRTFDPPKFADSDVEVCGTDIRVGKAGTLIDGMDEVRTIRLGGEVDPRFKCCPKNRQALVPAQQSSRHHIVMPIRILANGSQGWGRVVTVLNCPLCG
jgi:hypothetical protein